MARTRALIATGALTAALAATPAAVAHTLDRREATREAWLALHDWAEYHERAGETLVEVDLTRRDCFRQSRHRFECQGAVDYEGDLGRICYRVRVTVRYASRTSHRVRTRVHGARCI
jgi:hypothetical protein